MKKIVKQNEWLIACAGADRTCDVLQYITKYPAIPPTLTKNKIDEDWYKWVAKRIIPIIRKSAQDELSLDTKDGVAELPESELILVSHAKAFGISGSMGISRLKPYWAIGSGGTLALGSLATAYKNNEDWDSNAKEYLIDALEVAVKHDSFSHKPINGFTSFNNGRVEQWDSIDHA
jgi:ATP-dependent protease HslVU (ClpYQ) peptidase subunit